MKKYEIWAKDSYYIATMHADSPIQAIREANIYGKYKFEPDIINFKRSFNDNYKYEVINVETYKLYRYIPIYKA